MAAVEVPAGIVPQPDAVKLQESIDQIVAIGNAMKESLDPIKIFAFGYRGKDQYPTPEVKDEYIKLAANNVNGLLTASTGFGANLTKNTAMKFHMIGLNAAELLEYAKGATNAAKHVAERYVAPENNKPDDKVKALRKITQDLVVKSLKLEGQYDFNKPEDVEKFDAAIVANIKAVYTKPISQVKDLLAAFQLYISSSDVDEKAAATLYKAYVPVQEKLQEAVALCADL